MNREIDNAGLKGLRVCTVVPYLPRKGGVTMQTHLMADGQTTALLEASAWGLPIVTNPAGRPDMMEDGKEGIVVPVGDVGALAREVIALSPARPEERCADELGSKSSR